ncbi:uncharacterized protein TRUGW13939_03037 [Talaromyces rugulosus]|uniref:Uncharacterized protein n=1 Tax=Talaromyces rugulosus TaxID=121627 RepID=A0A7H8QPY3_TALRU|nr:uncharacterized protein TRUGW13939_03037 [Talaromyces rugulosus]QKX55938.1 hypothetical protein TRUGW13939_03037 [Talaromyces rugulosus]
MVEQDKSLVNYVKPWYKRRQTGLSESFDALWEILRGIINDPKPRTIVCVLDAIDECEPISRTLLIEGMGEFDGYQRDKRSQLKFLVTSRPYTEIDRQFRQKCSNLALIDMEDDGLSDQVGKEINLVIDDKIPRIFNSFRHPPNTRTQTEISEKLKGNNNRTYLWLKLMLDAIHVTTLPGDHQWAAFVKQMPTGLFDVYANILDKVDLQKRGETIKLFRILLAATRTLTLKELNVALVVADRIKENGHNARPAHDLCFFDEHKLVDYIRDISGRTVTIVGPNVYFIHLTMREFLTTGNPPAASWFSQSFQISHNTLAEICIWYILRQFEQQFGKRPLPSAWQCPLQGEKRDQTSYGEWYKGHHRDVKHFVETDPFLPYAESRWATHVRNSGDDLQIKLLPYVLELCGLKSKASIMWFQLYHTHRWFWDVARPTEFPTFVIIATCGLKAVLQKIWDNSCDANIDFQSQDFLQYSLRLSLLALVAREGHMDVVKFLLDKGAHPNPHPELNGMTPLHHASYRGHHLPSWKFDLRVTESRNTLQLHARLSLHSHVNRNFLVRFLCFQYIKFGRDFSRGFGFALCRLEAAELRLIRWGMSIGIGSPETKLQTENYSPEDIETACRWLEEIQEAFGSALKTSQRYERTVKDPDAVIHLDVEAEIRGGKKGFQTLHNRLRRICDQRLNLKPGTRDRLSWALYGKGSFENLVENISMLTTNLVELFPSKVGTQKELCQFEIKDLDPDSLTLLDKAIGQEDKILRATLDAEAEKWPNLYSNIEVTEHFRGHFGDNIGPGGASRRTIFSGIRAGGNAVAHFGHNVRMQGRTDFDSTQQN